MFEVVLNYKINIFLIFIISLLFLISITYIWPKFISLGLDNKFGIQKIHNVNSLRIGGFLIYLFFCISLIVLETSNQYLLLLVLLPVILAGFYEDLTSKGLVNIRLIATTISAVLACLFYQASVYKVDFIIVDNFLADNAILPYTFAIIGISICSHTWNFIDGVNGLASGLGVIVLLALAFLSYISSLDELFIFLIVFSTIIFSFGLLMSLLANFFRRYRCLSNRVYCCLVRC